MKTRFPNFDLGIKHDLTEREAQEWASRRWGCEATTVVLPHPRAIGDEVATITVTHLGRVHQGRGYSGSAPQGFSMWWKAARDLMRKEGGLR